VKSRETLGGRERAVVDSRRATGYRVARLRFADAEPTLRALVGRLLPSLPETIDVAAFVDSHADHSLGRGDRKAGQPQNEELLGQGLAALQARAFDRLGEAAQDELIRRMRHGDADEELGFAANDFIDRLLTLACAGYLAHPDGWERIGFNGPAYPDGYAWISRGATARRHQGFIGSGRL
jgi:Gluconate 2-dehydrogenase subunit 3